MPRKKAQPRGKPRSRKKLTLEEVTHLGETLGVKVELLRYGRVLRLTLPPGPNPFFRGIHLRTELELHEGPDSGAPGRYAALLRAGWTAMLAYAGPDEAGDKRGQGNGHDPLPHAHGDRT